MSNDIYIDQRQIVLSSSHADKYNNGTMLSSMVYFFQGLLINNDDIQDRFISVVNASLPYSHYIINTYNNTLVYDIGYGDVTATFSVGMYQAINFIDQFKAQMPIGFSLNINRLTGKYTISYTTDFTIKSTSTILYVLGLEKMDYTSSSLTINAPYPCDFSGLRSFKIKSNTLRTLNRDSYSNNFTNDICIINNTAPAYGITLYNNFTNLKSHLMTKTIDSIDIEITDQDDNEIDFSNREWTITLNLELHRKRNIQSPETLLLANIKEIMTQFIQIPQVDKPEEVSQENEQEEVVTDDVTNTNDDELNDNADSFADSNLEQYLYLKGIQG